MLTEPMQEMNPRSYQNSLKKYKRRKIIIKGGLLIYILILSYNLKEKFLIMIFDPFKGSSPAL